ncbi:unnamed protein product, partial [Ceratitis capitata]
LIIIQNLHFEEKTQNKTEHDNTSIPKYNSEDTAELKGGNDVPTRSANSADDMSRKLAYRMAHSTNAGNSRVKCM